MWRCARPNREHLSSGLSLLEALVVLGLIAIVSGLAASGLRGPSASLTREAAIAALQEQVATLRTRALISGTLVPVQLQPPEGYELRPCAGDDTAPEILLRPDGKSTGGRFCLHGPDLVTVLQVDWLTGQLRPASDSQ